MTKKDLQLKPHSVTSDFWWYEENQGISICIRLSSTDTITRNIPWCSLRAALKRKDKK